MSLLIGPLLFNYLEVGVNSLKVSLKGLYICGKTCHFLLQASKTLIVGSTLHFLLTIIFSSIIERWISLLHGCFLKCVNHASILGVLVPPTSSTIIIRIIG